MADRIGEQNPGSFYGPLTSARIQLPMYDGTAGDGTGGQQPGAGGSPQQQQQQTPAGGGQQQQQAQQQQPGAGGAGGGAAEKTYSFKEDRSDWVPRTRLNEVSGKLTRLETETLTLKQQLELAEKRTKAALGIETPDAKTAETEEIRSALYQMFPQLKALENLTAEQLQDVFEAANSARETSHASWERHATAMLSDLDAEAAKGLGADKLTPTQQKSLHRAYREEAALVVQERKQAVERGERNTLQTIASDTDFLARHERGDKTLLKEFVKAFLDDWYEPARRSVTARQASRQMRPVPRGERVRTPLTQGEAKVDLTNDSEFKKALIAARGSQE